MFPRYYINWLAACFYLLLSILHSERKQAERNPIILFVCLFADTLWSILPTEGGLVDPAILLGHSLQISNRNKVFDAEKQIISEFRWYHSLENLGGGWIVMWSPPISSHSPISGLCWVLGPGDLLCLKSPRQPYGTLSERSKKEEWPREEGKI